MQCNKRVKFYTLGCKVNQYETQAIREKFLYAGFRENNSEIADVYIVNTCTVTARADRESRRLIRRLLRSNPDSKIIVTGCYIEKDAAEILSISNKIRIVPNRQKHCIINFLNLTPDVVAQFIGQRTNFCSINGATTLNDKVFLPLKISDFKDHERAFVKIQDGCNNFCSYCKVPLVRGVSRSRSPKEITAEVERLTRRGFKEVVLTGICLGSYHYKSFDLAAVLSALENIEREFRIRLSSIEPQLISNDLIGRIADSEKICPHLHIPLQSGDNKILKRMNRRYTREKFLSLIAKIKKKIKDVAITTDILVGFPG
ncbi:MAG: MiaB/RimO family radical SAM methylthiotransferase, partial [Candidatus Omnitrophica bacterium]|nr:MiaB/RimO family radical SAM methylthiotransferase [Candidatus Omnitrophota bacterium]